jgi:citrate lyase subunit beta/citryl-CoA lyase
VERVAEANKAAARRHALAFLQAERTGSPPVYVRIHGLRAPRAVGDLDIVMTGAPDGIVLADACGANDLALLDARLAVAEALHGLPDGATAIIADVQSGAAMFDRGGLRGVTPRLAGLAWSRPLPGGAERTGAEGAGHPLAVARALGLFAAEAAGVPAIDAAPPPESGEADVRRACENARRHGFSAMLVLRLEDVIVVNETFATPLPAADGSAPEDGGPPETAGRGRGGRKTSGLMRFRRRG